MERFCIVYAFTELGIDCINHEDYVSMAYYGGIRNNDGNWYNSIGSYKINKKIFESTGLEWTPN